jgi:hypothetical protein
MLRKKIEDNNDYVEGSFHAYAINRIKECQRDLDWSTISEAEKTSLLSLMWFVYLDRLEYANYDIQPVINAFEDIFQLINATVPSLQQVSIVLADSIFRLNKLNTHQFELMEENREETYAEIYTLSKDMFHRLSMINQLLLKNEIDTKDLVERISNIFVLLNELSDDFHFMTLMHFYSTFTEGQYKSIASLCMASGFIQAVGGCLLYHLADKDNPILETVQHTAFEQYYEIEILCSLGIQFNFTMFGDDTNVLLPEVVEILFPGE